MTGPRAPQFWQRIATLPVTPVRSIWTVHAPPDPPEGGDHERRSRVRGDDRPRHRPVVARRLQETEGSDRRADDCQDQQATEQPPDEPGAAVALRAGVVATGPTDRRRGDESVAVTTEAQLAGHAPVTSATAPVATASVVAASCVVVIVNLVTPGWRLSDTSCATAKKGGSAQPRSIRF